MSNDFKTLIDFLDRFGPEVSGKALMIPDSEAAAGLQRLAGGACSKEERTELCKTLKQHPEWLRWLADRVKMARGSSNVAR